MSILVIDDNPCLTIEYSPTIIETSLELLLDKHGNCLSMPKYWGHYSIGDGQSQMGDPIVFSFGRESIKDINDFSLFYQKIFNRETVGKPLNFLIKNFNNKSLYYEAIGIGDKDLDTDKDSDAQIYLEFFKNGQCEVKHYCEELQTERLKTFYKLLIKYHEKIDERCYSFLWMETSASPTLKLLIDRLNSAELKSPVS